MGVLRSAEDDEVRARANDARREWRPLAPDLDVVVGSRNEGKGELRVTGEEEGEGNVEDLLLTRAAHELGGVAASAANGLAEAAAGLAHKLLHREKELGPDGVNGRATNLELNAL